MTRCVESVCWGSCRKNDGHPITSEGRCTSCTRCRRRVTTRWRSWLKPCAAYCGPAPAERPVGWQPPPVDDLQGNDITAASRRRILKKRKAVVKELTSTSNKEVEEAWRRLRGDSATLEFSDLPRSPQPPPQAIHPTHGIIVVGGFAGCLKCGCIGGRNYTQRLEDPCRRVLPRGSERAIAALAKGDLPHRQRRGHGEQWPTGEKQPTVYGWAPQADRLLSTRPAKRSRRWRHEAVSDSLASTTPSTGSAASHSSEVAAPLVRG